MEKYLDILPEEIVNKTTLYNSHPVADLIRHSHLFKLKKHKLERTHGCPFDRGSADAYYSRPLKPHKWSNGRRDGTVYGLTVEELKAYELGFFFEENRNRWC